jgi:hypothetical protein
MSEHIIKVAEGFWNIRGSFKVARLIDIGTHASLVRRGDGQFLLLDSYTLKGDVAREVDELTGGKENVAAVLNLHPFHTIHVRAIHERYPDAKHYGTARHRSRHPELTWQPEHTEDAALHDLFADDLEFSVPAGVDFISANEHVHFSSVLVMHRSSKTIHVDDTIMYIQLPRLLNFLGLAESMSFHPTLAKVLEKREGAAQDFRQWARSLADRWSDAENLCAAHTSALLGRKNSGESIRDRILGCLDKVETKLVAHERVHG